jgi:hypothetical protein
MKTFFRFLWSAILNALAALVWLAGQISFREIALAAGLSLVGYGLSLVYLPAAFVVPGLVLTLTAIFGVR